MTRNSALALVLVVIAALAVGGYFLFMRDRSEMNEYFCDDLADEKMYDKNKIAHYKILIPGREDWVFRTENDFRNDWKTNDKTVNYFLRLQEAMNSHNAQLVVVIPPVRGLIHADMLSRKDREKYKLEDTDAVWQGYENMLRSFRAKGLHFVGASKDQATPDFYYKRNHHWTSEGAKIVAQNVAQEVKNLENYKRIPAVEFETVEKGETAYPSSFSKGFEKACGTDVPDETAIQYETRPKNNAESSNALFDEQQKPQVVLLGTSNSVLGSSHANFEGYLKEYLSRDVINHSLIGAGIDSSLMSYLNSDHFRSRAPKIVIWEIPGYYDLNVMDDKLFNQVIPAAYGDCSDPLITRSFASVQEGRVVVWPTSEGVSTSFEDPEEDEEIEDGETLQPENPAADFMAVSQDLKSKYLHLMFSEPVKQDFDVDFEYEDGGVKTQEFSRSDRYPHDGSFYTLFPVNEGKELSKVLLSLPGGVPEGAQLDIRMCQIPQ